MKLFGIKFVPFNEPLKDRIQAFAAGAWFCGFTFGSGLCLYFSIHLLFTRIWWLILLYFCWIYFDRDVCETGGRPIKWANNCAWYRYAKDYFSAQCSMVSGLTLDEKRNYLFCCFPHGVLPAGPYFSLSSTSSELHQRFPNFQIRVSALKVLFYIPFTREIGLAMGGISCSARSLRYVLSKPDGGHVAILFPGGAEEAMYAQPGRYKFLVKKRRGFVKIALTSGAPLVPVVTFGEVDCFDQVQGSVISKLHIICKKYFGYVPVVLLGRGLFQLNFGFIPRKSSLITVVGKPIEVLKTENPTDEEIDFLHQKFVDELVKMFEKYKHKYLKNPNDTYLELV